MGALLPQLQVLMADVPRFVQLVKDERSINALDEYGGVWVYKGNQLGWAKLNMTVAEPPVYVQPRVYAKGVANIPKTATGLVPSDWD